MGMARMEACISCVTAGSGSSGQTWRIGGFLILQGALHYYRTRAPHSVVFGGGSPFKFINSISVPYRILKMGVAVHDGGGFIFIGVRTNAL